MIGEGTKRIMAQVSNEFSKISNLVWLYPPFWGRSLLYRGFFFTV